MCDHEVVSSTVCGWNFTLWQQSELFMNPCPTRASYGHERSSLQNSLGANVSEEQDTVWVNVILNFLAFLKGWGFPLVASNLPSEELLFSVDYTSLQKWI